MVKNEKRLKELQAQRRADEAAALREAELLVRLARLHKETLDPKAPIEANGFVFSTLQIIGMVNRKDRLAEAEFYEKQSWSPTRPWPKAA
ncbi:MAG: hypothetical protein JWN34_3601 [Bryobacterales bacterium]|nr:hypothetical protein [Bryobacterales bacterium]